MQQRLMSPEKLTALRAHLRAPRVIDVDPPGFWQRQVDNWRRAPLYVSLIAIVMLGWGLPSLIIVGGLLGLALWDHIGSNWGAPLFVVVCLGGLGLWYRLTGD